MNLDRIRSREEAERIAKRELAKHAYVCGACRNEMHHLCIGSFENVPCDCDHRV